MRLEPTTEPLVLKPVTPATFTCPRCLWTTYNVHDIRERYCGHCHVFVDDEALTDELNDDE